MPDYLVTVRDTAGNATQQTVPVTFQQPSGYVKVAGYDWADFASMAEVQALGFWGWGSAISESVYNFLSLVPDPVFGQVIRAEYRQSNTEIYNPRGSRQLPYDLADAWLRFRIRWIPGWTTVGSLPSGYANSWKMAFLNWRGMGARMEIEFSNTSQYILGAGFLRPDGVWIRPQNSPLPGSQPWPNASEEWTSGEWYEYVMHYQRVDSTTCKSEFWMKKLADSAYRYQGEQSVFPAPDSPPLVRGVELPANKNKMNPQTMYIDWGPWEVVDGAVYPNPFGV